MAVASAPSRLGFRVLPVPVKPFPNTAALAAGPVTVCKRRRNEVGADEGVALSAVRLGRVVGGEAATPVHHIYADGHRLKVERVRAPWVSAEMVNVIPVRNGADEILIGPPMGRCALLPVPENTVPAGAHPAGPLPAVPVQQNVTPKATDGRDSRPAHFKPFLAAASRISRSRNAAFDVSDISAKAASRRMVSLDSRNDVGCLLIADTPRNQLEVEAGRQMRSLPRSGGRSKGRNLRIGQIAVPIPDLFAVLNGSDVRGTAGVEGVPFRSVHPRHGTLGTLDKSPTRFPFEFHHRIECSASCTTTQGQL